MKKSNINIIIFSILFALCMVGTIAYAEQGKITANASASKNIAPDTATISFTIETIDKNSQKAVETNNQKAKNIAEIIKKSLNTNESIKTSSYSMRQNYEYNNLTKKNVPTGYIVTNTLTVTLKDTTKTGKIINTGIKNGATRVSNLGFTIQNTSSVCQELTAQAVTKAKAEAAAALKPLGKTIDSVYSVSYGCNTQSNFNSYRNYAMAKTMSAGENMSDEAINVEQGENKVEANVTIVFTIK